MTSDISAACDYCEWSRAFLYPLSQFLCVLWRAREHVPAYQHLVPAKLMIAGNFEIALAILDEYAIKSIGVIDSR